jgi:hypothetical protein
MLNLPFAISFLKELSFLYRVFFLALNVVGIYSLCFAVAAIVRLRRMKRNKDDVACVHRTLEALRRRSTRLQQLMTAAFYLFGLLLFVGLQDAYHILENFRAHFIFAAIIFFLFFMIHCVQWFVSAQLERCASRIRGQAEV